MIFATTCFGSDRISDTLHFLNDIRNINAEIYLITNQRIDLGKLQFNNVHVLFEDCPYYQDYFRYKMMLHIFKNTSHDMIYYLDCDTRMINLRKEKFDLTKFERLIKDKDFDILTAWLDSQPVSEFFIKPSEGENKSIRQWKYGYDSVINHIKNNFPDYENYMNLPTCWEGHLILKKSERIIEFLEKMIEIGNIMIEEDLKFGRSQIACTSSAMITFISNRLGLKLIKDPITHHFFKANFLREVFPFNWNIDENEKVLPDYN